MRPSRYIKTAAILATLWLTAQSASGQPSGPSPERKCRSALASRDARDAFPVLTSAAIREASCSCLATSSLSSQANSLDEKLLESAALGCIRRAAPAELAAPLPPVVAGLLEDAFATGSAGRVFSVPKALISACKMPEYPLASIRAEATAKSRLSFKIAASGKVVDGEIVSSAGKSPAHKVLDVTALFSLMQCQFEPARLRGNAVDAWVEVEYVWKLE